MSAQHAPGPWGRNIPPVSQYPVIFAGRNTHVAQVITKFILPSQAEANADLIAAAPDLLEALQRATKQLGQLRGKRLSFDLELAIATANKAITKAQA